MFLSPAEMSSSSFGAAYIHVVTTRSRPIRFGVRGGGGAALEAMGYDTKVDICGHGFRAMACSALVESGLWSETAIERQISHKERNNVRAAYTHKASSLKSAG